jgi:hypothetical protein
VAMTRGGFTQGLKDVKDAPKPRLLLYDEANLSKRDSIAKWNKMMIDTYFSIRGKNICHLWCNPSIDYLDKEFIEERIKRVFLLIKPKGKAKARPYRVYYYFHINDILQILDKYGDLKYKTIYKVRKKYATYMGWFKKYNGDAQLLEEYNLLKESRMDEKIDKLHETFGEVAPKAIEPAKPEGDSFRVMARKLQCAEMTIRKYFIALKNDGVLLPSVHYNVTDGGFHFITNVGFNLIAESLNNKYKHGYIMSNKDTKTDNIN